MNSWYIENGPESDVVISSRVRLARNFKDYPFPFRMNSVQAKKTIDNVKDAIFNSNSTLSKEVDYIDISNLNAIDRQALVEKHIISPDMAENQKKSGVITSKDEKISIMINEEDHLRIQCLFPGMQMDSAWKLCDKIDTLLEERIEFAFSKEHGYLTCCPTNIGTGLRASVMLHLPALMMTGYLKGVLDACTKLGVAVRGIYGENSDTYGNMFQISNQVTLGQTEEEIITNITNIAFQIIEQERTLRSELYKQNPYRFEDKVFRSFAIFANARMMSFEESLKLLSDVRLGVDMGIIKDISVQKLNEVMIVVQPANIQKLAGKSLSPDERDVVRAEVIRGKFIKDKE